jgi:hypothetical protein
MLANGSVEAADLRASWFSINTEYDDRRDDDHGARWYFRLAWQEWNGPIASQRGRSWEIVKSDASLARPSIGLGPMRSTLYPGAVNAALHCRKQYLEKQFGCTSLDTSIGFQLSQGCIGRVLAGATMARVLADAGYIEDAETSEAA